MNIDTDIEDIHFKHLRCPTSLIREIQIKNNNEIPFLPMRLAKIKKSNITFTGQTGGRDAFSNVAGGGTNEYNLFGGKPAIPNKITYMFTSDPATPPLSI